MCLCFQGKNITFLSLLGDYWANFYIHNIRKVRTLLTIKILLLRTTFERIETVLNLPGSKL